MIRVLIVDDHPIFRQGLRQLIAAEPDLEVVGEAADLGLARQALGGLHPEVAVIDLTIQGGSGLDLVQFCRQLAPPIAALVLTGHREEATFDGALDRGASGYILKENAIADVLLAIRVVASGGFYLSPSIAHFLDRRRQRLASASGPAAPLSRLSPTERRILRLIGANRTTKEIATELCISPRTIDTHRAHICEKLSLRGAQALLRFALENRGDLGDRE